MEQALLLRGLYELVDIEIQIDNKKMEISVIIFVAKTEDANVLNTN